MVILNADQIMPTTIVEISCIEVWREISNYVDGDLEPALKARMELHLQNCKHCTAVLEGTKNTVSLLADGDWYPMPAGFGERLFNRLLSEALACTKPSRLRRYGWRSRRILH
jgi:anti-sigma factor RsiW